jgi:hypothetical protein
METPKSKSEAGQAGIELADETFMSAADLRIQALVYPIQALVLGWH